ncbi:MAG: M14 family zinc carboxypeptidase, partial [Bacteroidales bacterium]
MLRARSVAASLTILLSVFLTLAPTQAQAPAQTVAGARIQTPEQFLGFTVGSDTKLARWDKIVAYMHAVAQGSDRVAVRELGKTTGGNPFISVEIAAADTLRNIGRFKQLERKLYFQGGAPTDAERDEIFQSGKAVVVVTCNIHSSEIGSSQMVLELVHRLATDNSPLVRKILDNVILVLVPSLNPDGQILVTDWYNKNLGTEYENSAMPWLYHPYVGHDNNRDAYMLTQKESQLTARLLWHDWFPVVWLDEHQQGNSGARIFVMPATDPINLNVHPLIYRWNGILGQAQAAALEAAGKDGIIYNATYTNYWEGAMAWAGWWHNEIGLLTEVASVRVASPVDQQRAELGRPPAPEPSGENRPRGDGGGVLPPPRDVMPRTEYPRPWLGGHWTLRDIVEYELIATMGLLETAADRRETLLRQMYEVNRATIENGRKGDPSAILIPLDGQQDARQAIHLAEKLQMGGVEVYRADAAFEADGKPYQPGTLVIPMTQVFARYAKDMLEKQTYPEVRRTPTAPPEPPYDVTAWSLGMLMGTNTVFVKKPLAPGVALQKVEAFAPPKGEVTGNAAAYTFDYKGPDSAIAVNRLLKDGARVTFGPTPGTVQVAGVPRKRLEAVAASSGIVMHGVDTPKGGTLTGTPVRSPRVGLYQSWTASMDEGWTRWVLEQYEFAPKTLHNEDIRAGKLHGKFDVIVLADQQPRD